METQTTQTLKTKIGGRLVMVSVVGEPSGLNGRIFPCRIEFGSEWANTDAETLREFASALMKMLGESPRHDPYR